MTHFMSSSKNLKILRWVPDSYSAWSHTTSVNFFSGKFLDLQSISLVALWHLWLIDYLTDFTAMFVFTL